MSIGDIRELRLETPDGGIVNRRQYRESIDDTHELKLELEHMRMQWYASKVFTHLKLVDALPQRRASQLARQTHARETRTPAKGTRR